MKNISILTSFCFAMILFTGCATQKRVAASPGSGTKAVYTATFDEVWNASINAAQQDGLQVTSSDRNAGYIAARRTVRPHTLGENVGIWVRSAGNTVQTEVEVLSRQAGPPVAWTKNWENELHRAIASNLSRGTSAYGTAPRGVYVEPAPLPRETAAEREQVRLIDALRAERTRREQDLRAETDTSRREAINRQLTTLDNDIRAEERRLLDLQRPR
jgi:hypothetical protein